MAAVREQGSGHAMKVDTIRGLAALNARFYAGEAASFSATRRAPWPGWRRCLPVMEDALRVRSRAASVLDVGCGNLRFEAFLANQLLDADLAFLAVDACEPLMADAAALPGNASVRTMALDVVAALVGAADSGAASGALAERSDEECAEACLGDASERCAEGAADAAGALARRFGEGAHDASVAFGFLHHVPSAQLRAAALEALVASTRSGGVAAVSLWRFLDDPDAARKADAAHARALDELAACGNVMRPRVPARCKAAISGAFPAAAGGGFERRAAPLVDPADFEPGDRLLGWQGKPGAYRYCHSFSDADVDALVAVVAGRAELAARFRADGRTGDANEYLVFRVR